MKLLCVKAMAWTAVQGERITPNAPYQHVIEGDKVVFGLGQ